MTKVKDEPNGIVYKDGSISKEVARKDMEKLDESAEIAKNILIQAGCDSKTIFNGKIAGGHPGGTAAIGVIINSNFETKKIKNLFVCDASIFPTSPGAPPMLTIVALAKHFSASF
jgi:choline dehydrogenase-like flavoprotein